MDEQWKGKHARAAKRERSIGEIGGSKREKGTCPVNSFFFFIDL